MFWQRPVPTARSRVHRPGQSIKLPAWFSPPYAVREALIKEHPGNAPLFRWASPAARSVHATGRPRWRVIHDMSRHRHGHFTPRTVRASGRFTTPLAHARGRPSRTGQAPSRYPAVAASRIMISLYRGCTLPMRTSTCNPGCALSSKSLRRPRTNMP